MSKILYEIILGKKITKIDGVKFELRGPTVYDLLEAEEIYEEAKEEASSEGLFTEDQFLDYLVEQDLWSIEEEKRMEEIPKNIDDLKVALHDSLGKSLTMSNLRKKLNEIRWEIGDLFNKKFKMNYLTIEGIATLSKSHFLICRTVLTPILSPFLLDKYNPLFDKVLAWKNNSKVGEAELRKIVRSEEWRSYWNSGDPFKKPTIELTEEQRSLIAISKMYDNIRESPDCPAEEVIEDDDVLDGWLIKQRRKRENAKNEEQINERIGNVRGDMILIPAETKEDAEKIDKLNSPVARMMKRQRLKILTERGTVAEQDFPDARLKMMNILKERK